MASRCIARLTKWEKCGKDWKDWKAIVKVCKNTPEKGRRLCQECSNWPTGGKYKVHNGETAYESWHGEVQSGTNESEEMKLKKIEKADPADKRGTLLEKFAPIKVMYRESAEPPEKLETDSCKIWKSKIGNIEVWITEFGLVFDADTTGSVGELLGHMHHGTLIGVDEG